jgi:serine/threonine-protein phosphatase 4 regulatory subunit 1
VHGADGATLVTEVAFWRALRTLAADRIVDVRIGVARLVGIICDRFYRESASIPGDVLDLVVVLAGDPAADVRAFVSVDWRTRPPLPPRPESSEIGPTFSRPPPPVSASAASSPVQVPVA